MFEDDVDVMDTMSDDGEDIRTAEAGGVSSDVSPSC